MRTAKPSGSFERRLSRRTLLASSLAGPLLGAGQTHLVDHPGEKVSFLAGGRLLFEYRYSRARPKTYVHPLCAPDGRVLTLDSPPDHVHHRGVMIAWSKVNGYDFWGEVNPAPHGRILHQRFERIHEHSPAEVTDILHWVAGGEVLLVERRTIRALAGFPRAVALDWTTELVAALRPVRVAAGQHVYDGLGIRFIHAMDGGRVLNARGTTVMAKANGERADWCGYCGPPGGKQAAGIVVFDHPGNPRHPTPFFVMNKPFGYLSAAPTFYEPFPLERGGKLRLRYAVLAFAAVPARRSLERMYREWTGRR